MFGRKTISGAYRAKARSRNCQNRAAAPPNRVSIKRKLGTTLVFKTSGQRRANRLCTVMCNGDEPKFPAYRRNWLNRYWFLGASQTIPERTPSASPTLPNKPITFEPAKDSRRLVSFERKDKQRKNYRNLRKKLTARHCRTFRV